MIVRSQPDERWVRHFITQRDKREKEDKPQNLSILALIKPLLNDGYLSLTWNYQEPIEVPYDLESGKELAVKVWDHESYAIDQGDSFAEWLSDHLNLGVRLVKASGPFARRTSQSYKPNDNPIRFQDGYPIHWFFIESLYELNNIAGKEIPWQTFRPQMVAEGIPASYEHKIENRKIAGIPFADPKPCERCPVTLINQETGELRGRDPLFSLSKYKKWRNRKGEIKVIFGENMLPFGYGEISIGDEMAVSSLRNPPLEYGPKV